MKRAIGFTFLILVLFSLIQILGPTLQAQGRNRNQGNQPRDGACFYVDENYKGEEFCVDGNESQRKIEARYDNRISSIRVFGRAQVTVYENENFNGSRQTFSRNVPKLQNWSDRITSFQFTGDRRYGERDGSQAGGQYGRWGRGNEPRDGVCFYVDRDYQGEEFCVDGNESQRKIAERYNDRISSVRIFGRAQVVVYEHENFGGARRVLTRETPSLGDFSDRISSIEVTGGARSRGGEARDSICFYMDRDYQGEEFCVDVNESQRKIEARYNDRISSVRILGRAQVVVYEHENFGGARRVLAGDTPGLGDFNDRISSIQVTDDRIRSSQPRDGACFYADRDYQGEEFCMNSNESQRKIAERYNDRISSVRIFGRVQVVAYEHENFGGARRVFANDTAGLGDFNDKITSIQVR